jgi:hypothetical protein
MDVTHPITTGTKVRVERPRRFEDTTVTECEGQLGTGRVWWYKTADGKRASEYQIVAVLGGRPVR